MTRSAQNAIERMTSRALARSAVYRLLSQSLAFPSQEALVALRREDLPQAQTLAPHLPRRVAAALSTFSRQALDVKAASLGEEHRRVLTHIMSVDCPANETVYTTTGIFQETEQLGDVAGFYRAFGLELAERERPDHISVELEFMHIATFKEAYARAHHTEAKARLCHDAQRSFVRDHLGRWAGLFALLLRRKAGGGYYAAVADLLDTFVAAEVGHLRVRPEAVTVGPDLTARDSEEDLSCPFGQECAVPEGGPGHVRLYSS